MTRRAPTLHRSYHSNNRSVAESVNYSTWTYRLLVNSTFHYEAVELHRYKKYIRSLLNIKKLIQKKKTKRLRKRNYHLTIQQSIVNEQGNISNSEIPRITSLITQYFLGLFKFTLRVNTRMDTWQLAIASINFFIKSNFCLKTFFLSLRVEEF